MATLSNGKLYIKKRPPLERIAILILLAPFFTPFLSEFLGLPDAVKFLADVLLILTLGALSLRRRVRVGRRLRPLVSLVLFFIAFSLIVYLFQYQSILYFLWGLRNKFRGYAAFFAFVFFLGEDTADGMFRLFDGLFWLNAAVCFVQYFFLGLSRDYLGGLFGSQIGCNGPLILFLTVMTARSLLRVMNGDERLSSALLKSAAALLIAAVGELKFFYPVFLLVLVLAAVVTRFSFKKFLLFFGGALLVILTSRLLGSLFTAFDRFLSFDNLWSALTLSHYATADDIGRLTAIPYISSNFLPSFPQKLVGIGLGNGDSSSLAFLNTPFFEQYSYIHYHYFMSAFLFLEVGYVGLILFLLFFVLCLIYAVRSLKAGTGNRLYHQLAIVMVPVCLILTFYNSSFYMDCAFLAYFVLALPFISNRERPLL